ncbi:hypothetical protein V7S78_06970 [Aquirufa regiilacus]
MKSILAVILTAMLLIFSLSSCSSNSSPSEVVDNISNRIQDEVASTNAEVFNENNKYSECFLLSDITIYKGDVSVRVEPNQELILQRIIKNIGETIVLTNFKVIINDTYSYTATSDETLNYVGSNSPFDTSDSRSLVVDSDLLGNCSIYLNGHFADETGNRFNYNNTKILNIKFICDQFSLERNY